MSINSINSVSSSSTAAVLQSVKPEAVEPRRVGPDHDGDADDRVGASSAAKPVVNTSGQSTGYLVNTQA